MKNSTLLFGVMSGTSLDGIDIVLINQTNRAIKIIEFIQISYSTKTKNYFLRILAPLELEINKFLLLTTKRNNCKYND